ncbi:MAG: SDR family oxidoreductase [Gammaproteobacteria bacterium]
MHHVVIVGCGDIGRRVAVRSLGAGAQVNALARSEASAAALAALGITPVAGDLDRPETLHGLGTSGALLYYFAPPPGGGSADTRMRDFLATRHEANAPARIVYISTSGVYGNHGGASVNEDTPPAPQSERSRRRLDAEDRLRAWCAAHGTVLVILRVGGIYGPGRLPVERIRAGTPVLREGLAPTTNRIHSEDLADICFAAGQPGAPDGVFNVADEHAGNMTEYFYAVADALGLARPPAVDWDEAQNVLSGAMLSYLNESRRLDTRRLREVLGITLRYPDLAAGLAASLGNDTQSK